MIDLSFSPAGLTEEEVYKLDKMEKYELIELIRIMNVKLMHAKLELDFNSKEKEWKELLSCSGKTYVNVPGSYFRVSKWNG